MTSKDYFDLFTKYILLDLFEPAYFFRRRTGVRSKGGNETVDTHTSRLTAF